MDQKFPVLKENRVDKMLAVVFENENAAYKGVEALSALNLDSSIFIYAAVVITKNADGTISTKRVDGEFPLRTLGGTALGSIIGLFGGPIGVGIGAAAGALAGGIGDVYASRVDSDFLSEVSAALTPGKWAVLANISEEWVTPIDSKMEAIGGFVYRTPTVIAEDDHWSREAAAMRAEIDQLKAEHAKARAERKLKLQAQIDRLNERRAQKLAAREAHSERVKEELQAKVAALEAKAAKEKGDVKAAFQARITGLQSLYQHHSNR